MAKHYTEEERTHIFALYQNDSTAPELCAKYGMSRSSLYGWIRQYSGGLAKTKSAREFYLLEKEIERLRITNEILINCGCSITAPLQEKLPAITIKRPQQHPCTVRHPGRKPCSILQLLASQTGENDDSAARRSVETS
jgi:transposase-like protein